MRSATAAAEHRAALRAVARLGRDLQYVSGEVDTISRGKKRNEKCFFCFFLMFCVFPVELFWFELLELLVSFVGWFVGFIDCLSVSVSVSLL